MSDDYRGSVVEGEIRILLPRERIQLFGPREKVTISVSLTLARASREGDNDGYWSKGKTGHA